MKSGPALRFHSPNCTILTVLPEVVRKSRPNAPANHRAWSSNSVGKALAAVSANASGGCQTDSNKNP